jgi:hypothetical protein
MARLIATAGFPEFVVKSLRNNLMGGSSEPVQNSGSAADAADSRSDGATDYLSIR